MSISPPYGAPPCSWDSCTRPNAHLWWWCGTPQACDAQGADCLRHPRDVQNADRLCSIFRKVVSAVQRHRPVPARIPVSQSLAFLCSICTRHRLLLSPACLSSSPPPRTIFSVPPTRTLAFYPRNGLRFTLSQHSQVQTGAQHASLTGTLIVRDTGQRKEGAILSAVHRPDDTPHITRQDSLSFSTVCRLTPASMKLRRPRLPFTRWL